MKIKFRGAWYAALLAAALAPKLPLAGGLKKPASQTVENEIATAQEPALEKFAGFYRFPNRVAYLQFSVREGQLTARQVWDGRTYPLVRDGDTRFKSKEEEYNLVFDLSSAPATVTVLNRIVLSRVDFDPTIKRGLTEDEARRWTGRYRMAKDPTMTAEVMYKNGKLVLRQAWDGEEVPFKRLGASEFINESKAFPLEFRQNSDGKITMICLVEDLWERLD